MVACRNCWVTPLKPPSLCVPYHPVSQSMSSIGLQESGAWAHVVWEGFLGEVTPPESGQRREMRTGLLPPLPLTLELSLRA